MARVKQTVTKRTRTKKVGAGMKRCPNCGGDGVVRVRKSKSGKKK